MIKKEFIKKAKEIYGNKYDYKEVPDIHLEYYTMIPIKCDKHGLFYQTVYEHLNGKGCFDCYTEDLETQNDR